MLLNSSSAKEDNKSEEDYKPHSLEYVIKGVVFTDFLMLLVLSHYKVNHFSVFFNFFGVFLVFF